MRIAVAAMPAALPNKLPYTFVVFGCRLLKGHNALYTSYQPKTAIPVFFQRNRYGTGRCKERVLFLTPA